MTHDFPFPEEKQAAAISRRMAQYFRPAEKIVIKIIDIPITQERRIQVTLESGHNVWLPRKSIDFVPGAVVLPVWLYKKLSGYFPTQCNGGIDHERVSKTSSGRHTAKSF